MGNFSFTRNRAKLVENWWDPESGERLEKHEESSSIGAVIPLYLFYWIGGVLFFLVLLIFIPVEKIMELIPILLQFIE